MADDLWSTFPHDPREKANAGLRASDEDRERITAALGKAFAEGRLDHDELEERMAAAGSARLLGDLPPLVADLVPDRPPRSRSSRSLVGVPAAELHERAVEEWRDDRRGAVFGFVGSAIICWAIWFATGADYFPWPVIVNALALLNVISKVANRDQIVREEVRRLEKKQARQQRWPKGLP